MCIKINTRVFQNINQKCTKQTKFIYINLSRFKARHSYSQFDRSPKVA